MNEDRYRQAERRFWDSVGVAPTEQQLELPRTGTTVRVQEIGEGPAVVFVHGASNSGTSWASLVSRLDGFRCLMIDRPGCGLSPPLATHFENPERLAAFAESLIVDVLDAAGLDTAHVVATSFGGYIGLRTAAAHPDRVDRLVELGWTIGAPIARTPLSMRIASVPVLGRLLAAVPPTERSVRWLLRGIGLRGALETGRFSKEALTQYTALLRDTDTMRNELAAGPRILTPLRGMNGSLLLPESLLSGIRTPTFFLWGEDDPFGGAEVARAFVDQMPNSDLELMPGGHAVWIDDADYVATAARKFLTR